MCVCVCVCVVLVIVITHCHVFMGDLRLFCLDNRYYFRYLVKVVGGV